jgi:uncharacterized protein
MLKWLTAAADNGYDRAQAQLGRLYLEGLPPSANAASGASPFQRSTPEAFNWFRRSAERGNPVGQFYLGRMLQTGQGTVRNLEESAKWLDTAAQSGFAPAIHHMGIVYELGLGRESDTLKALNYFKTAAKAGVREAQERLARIYADGELGEPRNLDESARWIKALDDKK